MFEYQLSEWLALGGCGSEGMAGGSESFENGSLISIPKALLPG